MRIALFTIVYTPYFSGVAKTYGYFADYCKKKKIKLDVFTYGETDNVTSDGTVRVIRIKPSLPIHLYPSLATDINFFTLTKKVQKYFNSNDYDIIHTATPDSLGIVAIYLAKKYHIPLIGHYHTALGDVVEGMIVKKTGLFKGISQVFGRIGKIFTEEVLRLYYNRCNSVLTTSKFYTRYLERELSVPIFSFVCGVDTKLFKPRRKPKKNFVQVLYVGRITVEKNVDMIFEASKGIKKIKIIVASDGPYRKELMKKNPEAEYPGFLSDKKLAELYSASDIFFFPSETEFFGNVILEAMTSGLPVLVSDKRAAKELVVDGETGYICKNTREYNSNLRLLVNSESLRNKMSKAALRYASTMQWDSAFDEFINSYKKTILKFRQ